jgi:hypothetical protein
MSSEPAGQPGGGEEPPFTEWTDPRYAEMVERVYATGRSARRPDGSLPARAFVYELPTDRRPPTA